MVSSLALKLDARTNLVRLMVLIGACVGLFAVAPAAASAAFAIPTFSATPSTTQKSANPNLATALTRSGTNSEDLRNTVLTLPTGMTVTPPPAASRCSSTQFSFDNCPASSQVGVVNVTGKIDASGANISGGTNRPLFSLADGSFGYVLNPASSSKVFVKQTLTTVSGRRVFTTSNLPREFKLLGLFNYAITINGVQVTYAGKAGSTGTGPAFITNPATCGAATSNLKATSYQNINVNKSSVFTVTGCVVVAPDTIITDALPAAPTLTPSFNVSSDYAGASFECSVNDGPFTACVPSTGTFGPAFTNAATNKLKIRAVVSGTPDATPATTYIWTDTGAVGAGLSVTPATTQAGAHPNIAATATVNGGHNLKSLTVDLPPGLSVSTTATSQVCSLASATAGTCAATAPQSKIGTVTATAVSSRDGAIAATGELFATVSPSSSSSFGAALTLDAPNGLGQIRATGELKLTQSQNGTTGGRVQNQVTFPAIPQRTHSGNRIHLSSVTLNVQGDPSGGMYPLLTNPTSCPATAAQFSGEGTTYGADGLDTSNGPAATLASAPYPVTGCAAIAFGPSSSQDFFQPDPIDGSAWDITNPIVANVGSVLASNDPVNSTRLGHAGVASNVVSPGATAMKEWKTWMPTFVGMNAESFGLSADKCPGASAALTYTFKGSATPASNVCNDISIVGRITIDTPLFDEPLIGNVHLIQKTALPWFGVDINPSVAATNPAGLTLRLTGVTNVVEMPSCNNALQQWCGDRIDVTFGNLPDFPISSIDLDLSGQTARAPRSGNYLSPLLYATADEGDPFAHQTDVLRSVFIAHNGATSTTDQEISLDHGPDVEDPLVNISSPSEGQNFTTNSAVVNFTVSDNQDPNPSCDIADGDSVPLVLGANVITVTCTDTAGNSGADTVNVTYSTADTQDPVVDITSPVDGSSVDTPSVPVIFDVTDNADPAPSCDFSSGSPWLLALGANVITVTCTDASGNDGSDSVTVTYDPTDPVVEITSPVNNQVVNAPSVPVVYDVTDNLDASPTCNFASGASLPLSLGANTLVVTCTDDAGNQGTDSVDVTRIDEPGGDTLLSDPLPSAATLTPTFNVTSDNPSATFECRINGAIGWTACDPTTGSYGASLFNNAASNMVQIRATTAGSPDPTPVTTHIWTDTRPVAASATATPSTTQAGAHPDMTSTVTLNGGYNPKSVTVDLPPGLNGALTGVEDAIPGEDKCLIASALAGTCATTAPNSLIGTASGTAVSTRDGLVSASGNLYMTVSPNSSSPAGVALDMQAPNGLGNIRSLGEVRVTQTQNGTSNGLIRQQIIVPSIPQRTDSGNRFHVVSATMNIQGNPPGGSYPLLTNPTTCPATPANITGTGTTYGADGSDASVGPPVPPVFVPYPVTGCASVPFSPTLSQEFFMPDPIDGSGWDNSAPVVQSVGSALATNDAVGLTRLGQAGVLANVTMPLDNSGIKNLTVYEPTFFTVNGEALGASADKCPGASAAITYTFKGAALPANNVCNDISIVGKMKITSPLLSKPVVGNVHMISKTPLPWFGIDINPSVHPDNPIGVTLRLTGVTNIAEMPDCDDGANQWCGDRIVVAFNSLPDVPLTAASLDLSGQTARAPRLGNYLSPLTLASADEGDTSCHGTDVIRSIFAPQTGGANVTIDQTVTATPC